MKYFLVLFLSSLSLRASLAVVPQNPVRDSLVGREVMYATLKGFSLPVDQTTAQFIESEIRAATDNQSIYVWPSPTDPMTAEIVSTDSTDTALLSILNSAQAIVEVLSSDVMKVEDVGTKILL